MEQHDVVAGEADEAYPAMRGGGSLYTRTMPGGGHVRVEMMVSDRGDVGAERRRGRVVVEPGRDAMRRAESASVVVEELEGDDENAMVSELLRIARDNAAIARRMLRGKSAVRRAD